MTLDEIGFTNSVIASEAKQSRASYAALDCFVAFAPRNDGKIRLNLNLLTASTRDVCAGWRRRNTGS
jgi:hypothetical protein